MEQEQEQGAKEGEEEEEEEVKMMVFVMEAKEELLALVVAAAALRTGAWGGILGNWRALWIVWKRARFWLMRMARATCR